MRRHQLVTYFNFNDSGVANGQPATAAALASDAPGLRASVISSNLNNPTTNLVGRSGHYAQPSISRRHRSSQGLTVRQGANPGNNGNYVQFSVSTARVADLSLSYATTHTGTGFTTQTLSYSVNGGSFITVGTFTAFDPTAGTFVLASFDLSAINAIENQTSVTFRITFSGATNAAGTNTLDNIQLTSATAVPEPATVGAGLLGVGALCWHQRRRFKGLARLLAA